MITRDIPKRPWEEIVTDLFILNQKDYLLICDTFSKYLPLLRCTRKQQKPPYPSFNSFSNNMVLQEHFIHNEYLFSSEKFTAYIMQQQVQHIKSSLIPLSQIDSLSKASKPLKKPLQKVTSTSIPFIFTFTTRDQTT